MLLKDQPKLLPPIDVIEMQPLDPSDDHTEMLQAKADQGIKILNKFSNTSLSGLH